MKRFTVLLATLAAASALAQPTPPTPPAPPVPPHGGIRAEAKLHGRAFEGEIRRQLVTPQLLMRFQGELGLSDAQRSALISEIQKSESQQVQTKWQLAEAARQLSKMLEGPKVDEGKALAQADRVMQLERELKRGHLALMIRLKNQLTEEQQRKLRDLKAAHRGTKGRKWERRLQRGH